MTTICTDGKTIACDSQDTIDDVARFCGTKLYQLADGRVAGIAGEWGRCKKMIDFLDGKIIDINDAISEYDEDFDSMLLIAAKGRCWLMRDYECQPYAVDPPQAIGSGQNFAFGAMLAGMDAAGAVRVAALMDVNTGGDVHVMELTEWK